MDLTSFTSKGMGVVATNDLVSARPEKYVLIKKSNTTFAQC